MRPRKKKPSTLVLGTVSTRSTRRESVVKFEVFQKTEEAANNMNTDTDSKADSSISDITETNTKVLELLQDWSDGENSNSSSINKLQKNIDTVSRLPDDQQSLIDILEGNVIEPCESESSEVKLENGSVLFLSQPDTKKNINLEGIVGTVNLEVAEPHIIEECLVEDNSIFVNNPPESIIDKSDEIPNHSSTKIDDDLKKIQTLSSADNLEDNLEQMHSANSFEKLNRNFKFDSAASYPASTLEQDISIAKNNCSILPDHIIQSEGRQQNFDNSAPPCQILSDCQSVQESTQGLNNVFSPEKCNLTSVSIANRIIETEPIIVDENSSVTPQCIHFNVKTNAMEIDNKFSNETDDNTEKSGSNWTNLEESTDKNSYSTIEESVQTYELTNGVQQLEIEDSHVDEYITAEMRSEQLVSDILNMDKDIDCNIKLPIKLKNKRTARANQFSRRKSNRTKNGKPMETDVVNPVDDHNGKEINLNEEINQIERNEPPNYITQLVEIASENLPKGQIFDKEESINCTATKNRKRQKKVKINDFNLITKTKNLENKAADASILFEDRNSNASISSVELNHEAEQIINKENSESTISNVNNLTKLCNGDIQSQNIHMLNNLISTETGIALQNVAMLLNADGTVKNENKAIKAKGKKRAPRKPKEINDGNQKGKKKNTKLKKIEKIDISDEVRRSDRIKTMPLKKRSYGIVRSKEATEIENSESSPKQIDSDKTVGNGIQTQNKKDKPKFKTKSIENRSSTPIQSDNYPQIPKPIDKKTCMDSQYEIKSRLKMFVHLKENQYKTDRQYSKETEEMVCNCYLAEEDIEKGEFGCGDDCLNRLLMIECGRLCQIGERCTNKRFQKGEFAPVEVFKTDKKGLGLRAGANIPYGEFILEYVGEVLNPFEFDKRAEVYSQDKNAHFYFMSLRVDAIIDATMKGNISRFINHSCEPNAETQKWTVNGELRIGFFSTRTILAGEEITFDYRFQRYGKEAQKCYCEAPTCRGWLGEQPDESDEEEDDEEESKELQSSPKTEEQKLLIKSPDKKGIYNGEILDVDEGTNISSTISGEESEGAPKIIKKRVYKKKSRKDTLYEDFDLDDDIQALITTGLKNQNHTLKLSRLMVRAKELEQRKKLLRVLRRAELPCRRLFLDYHGLRLMHGYMIDSQQFIGNEGLESRLQAKLELLQTLAVLPIQNKTMLIESQVLATVEQWSKNEIAINDENERFYLNDVDKNHVDFTLAEKTEEITFLASRLMEEWSNLKESFRIPKKQRIEQMKEHEKEANKKFMASAYGNDQEPSRKHDSRHRLSSRSKLVKDKKAFRSDDRDRPSAAFLQLSKHERRKLFALKMELKEEERKRQQREMWRQHEMNCMMIGADPRFTAPFDPGKGFQNIWNPSMGQWQTVPVPTIQNQRIYNPPLTTNQNYSIPSCSNASFINTYQPINMQAHTSTNHQYPGIQPNITPMMSTIPSTVTNLTPSLSGMSPIGPPIAVAIGQPMPDMVLYPQEDSTPSNNMQVEYQGTVYPPINGNKKWKIAFDEYGRTYFYDRKRKISVWHVTEEIIDPTNEISDSSSSDSKASPDLSLESESDDDLNDNKLLLAIRKQLSKSSKLPSKIVDLIKLKDIEPNKSKDEVVSATPVIEEVKCGDGTSQQPVSSSIDLRLKEQFNLENSEQAKKKRKVALCEEIMISPRTEEAQAQAKEDGKKYRAIKEKLKRQKMNSTKKKVKLALIHDNIKVKEKRSSKNPKSQIKEMNDWNNEDDKRVKETFRSEVAGTVVSVLNAYRKHDCKEGRIVTTEDFKHLARKLTHFVMLKEMKHLDNVQDLQCTDNVKAKAREYIKKYMNKFGKVYQKRPDEPDFKD